MLGNKHNLLFLKCFSKTLLIRHGVLVLLGLISAAVLAQTPGGGSASASPRVAQPTSW